MSRPRSSVASRPALERRRERRGRETHPGGPRALLVPGLVADVQRPAGARRRAARARAGRRRGRASAAPASAVVTIAVKSEASPSRSRCSASPKSQFETTRELEPARAEARRRVSNAPGIGSNTIASMNAPTNDRGSSSAPAPSRKTRVHSSRERGEGLRRRARAARSAGSRRPRRRTPADDCLGRRRRRRAAAAASSEERHRVEEPDERAVAVDGDGVELSETHPDGAAGRPAASPSPIRGPGWSRAALAIAKRPFWTARSLRVAFRAEVLSVTSASEVAR